MKQKVLFVCIHNSARSQMAAAFLSARCNNAFEVHSAGLEPGKLNPVVVQVMTEVGFDIAGNQPKGVLEYLRAGTWFQYIITVCDEASAERCPIFPGISKRLHWGFPDPSAFSGTPEERLARTREVRDMIWAKVAEFCNANCASAAVA